MMLVQLGSVACTIRPTGGGGGNAGLIGGVHRVVFGGVPLPHWGGAEAWGISVVAFPDIAMAANTLVPVTSTAKARGLPPNTGMELIKACVVTSNAAITLVRE